MTFELGTVLLKDTRNVEPAHVVRIACLLKDFINQGLNNGVVLAKKLEMGISEALANAPHKCPNGQNIDYLAHRIAEHIRCCFTMLRWLLLDRSNTNHGSFSKSSSFSRKAKTSELVIINCLVDRMKDLKESEASCTALVPYDGRTACSQVLGL